jgi:hypothetical protein
MNSNRTELERLDRDTLIARAEQSGVARARILTRPELIDELLTRASSGRPDDLARVRGLFGRARDLLARVVERGLHLPDAADRLRGRLAATPLLRQEAPLPTVTLAEIYAAQGHRERAVDTLKDVLDREPEHSAARALIERLQDAAYTGPEPPALPPEDEIFASRESRESVDPASATRVPATLRNVPEDGETESTPRDDECVAIPVDGETLFVHWAISDWTREHLMRARPRGALVLRVLVVAPTWDGPDASVRDTQVRDERGDAVVRGLPEGAVLRAMIGWSVDGALVPIAHSPALEALERDAEGSVETVARWTLRGVTAVEAEDRDAGAIERAFGAMRARARAREVAGP